MARKVVGITAKSVVFIYVIDQQSFSKLFIIKNLYNLQGNKINDNIVCYILRLHYY